MSLLRICQISKMIQSGGSFGSWLGNLGKKTLTNLPIGPLENSQENDQPRTFL